MPLLSLVAALALALGVPSPVLPKDPKGKPAPGVVAPPAASPVATLERALERVRWERGGALLVVDPQHTGPRTPAGPPPSKPSEPTSQPGQPPPRPGRPLRLAEVAPFFGRRVVRLETLTVLAPTEMVVLNPRPGPPALPAGLPRSERLRFLLAMLSPAQWRKLGGPAGLGVGDLSSAEHRALFLSVLPDPLSVTRQAKDPDARWGVRREKLPPLAPAQRAQARLRVKRTMSLWIPRAQDPDNPNGAAGIDSFDRVPEEGYSFYFQDAADGPGGERHRAHPWGVPVRQAVPSRLKPGHLPFDATALSVPVALTGAATVGDLVKLAGQAAGLELYADLRVAGLPVWTRGEAARAGDVLKALCYAVTGTFRRVGPAYVLTDDVLGIGARGLLLRDWAGDARAAEEAAREASTERIRALQPLASLGFSPDDPYAPGPALMRRLEEYWADGNADAPRIAVSDLPPALAAAVRKTMTEQTNPQLVQDHVRLDVRLSIAYVVPGLGEVDHNLLAVDAVRNLLPRKGAPEEASPAADAAAAFRPLSLPVRALLVRPDTTEEAARAARAARLRGFTHLWVELPETGGTELLRAALAAGEGNPVPVVAVARLLRKSPPGPDGKAASADADVETNAAAERLPAYARRRLAALSVQRDGEAAAWLRDARDWLRADDAATAARMKRRLTELSSVPGLAGLVLQDPAAPGFAEPDRWVLPEAANSWDAGYGDAIRLSFLRQAGVDPVDLPVPADYRMDLRLPFFPEEVLRPRLRREGGRVVTEPGGESPVQRWNRLRFETSARLLTGLFAAVRSARPDLPVWVQGRSGDPSRFSWFRRWDGSEATLPRQAYGREARHFAEAARHQGGRNVLGLSWPPSRKDGAPPELPPPGATRAGGQDWLGHLLGGERDLFSPQRGWEGVVLDVSALPAGQLLPMLGGVNPSDAVPAGADTGADTGK